MTSRRTALVVLAVSAFLIVWSGRVLSQRVSRPYPPMTELIMTENYVQDLGALVLGARRLGADLAYIQWLQYYGVTENPDAEEAAEREGKFHDLSEGKYPRLFELADRIMRIDPYFTGPILEAAGALEFNQHRSPEAMALLQEGIKRDPYFFRYHLYLAAILFKENGNDRGLMETLIEAIKYPDCPPLFELILGNLLKKNGRYGDAARVFFHTMQTAPQQHDRIDAERRLKLLIMEHREAAGALQAAIR